MTGGDLRYSQGDEVSVRWKKTRWSFRPGLKPGTTICVADALPTELPEPTPNLTSFGAGCSSVDQALAAIAVGPGFQTTSSTKQNFSVIPAAFRSLHQGQRKPGLETWCGSSTVFVHLAKASPSSYWKVLFSNKPFPWVGARKQSYVLYFKICSVCAYF